MGFARIKNTMGFSFKELEGILGELLPEGLKTEGDYYGWFGEKPPKGEKIEKIAVVVDLRRFPTGYDAVITHHAPYSEVNVPTFVIHTPLDRVKWGTSGTLAELLGLQNVEPLTEKGFGHIGVYKGAEPFLQRIKERVGTEPLRYFLPREPQRVAVFPGCGFLFDWVIEVLREKKADILVSGDLTYHTALKLRSEGIGYVDVGHYTSEKFGVKRLAEKLRGLIPPNVEVDFIDWGEV